MVLTQGWNFPMDPFKFPRNCRDQKMVDDDSGGGDDDTLSTLCMTPLPRLLSCGRCPYL
jgi:hypothetical protein